MVNKKRYGIVIVSVIMLMIAGVLMINKDSYAAAPSYDYNCPRNLYFGSVPEEVSYIKDGNNKITLPDWTYYREPKSGLPHFMII